MTWSVLVEPLDTLFFREGTPFHASESLYIPSIFPPTPQTGYGFSRALLLTHYCLQLPVYIKNGCENCTEISKCCIKSIVGSPTLRDGSLCIKGPYIYKGERLFPAPLDLTHKNEFVNPAILHTDSIITDLGNTRFIASRSDYQFMKGLDDLFISESALLAYLHDEEFPKSNLYGIRKKNGENLPLVYSEPYVGIAIDTKTRSSKDNHLYNIERLRLGNEVNLWFEIGGILADFEIPKEKAILRLGGEGKQAIATVKPGICLDSIGIVDKLAKTGYMKLVLLQHADFGGNWYPPNFTRKEHNGQIIWVGEINGISMNMISACVGKPVYIGGWDISKGKPRTLEPQVPAGSIFYMKIDPTDSTKAVNTIHDQHIGLKTNLGFGHTAVGVWNNE